MIIHWLFVAHKWAHQS